MKRQLLAAALIVLLTAASTATAALLEVKQFADALNLSPRLHLGTALTPAQAGAPQTVLVIGSDKRASTAVDAQDPPHSDTLMLVRFDPNQGVTSTLSIPRDLKIQLSVPHRGVLTEKINFAYTIGGPRLAVRTIRHLLGVKINHVVDVSFRGFREAVDAVGCVYIDVDRRYFNDNAGLGYGQQYAVIDIKPGYQMLCGQTALDYVRYRHTDSDFTRVARQQDFMRQAKDQVGVMGLIEHRGQLEQAFGRSVETDVRGSSQVLRIFKLIAFSLGRGVRQVPFEATAGPSYVTATPAQIHASVEAFLHPVTPVLGHAHRTARATHRHRHHHRTVPTGPIPGLTQATAADLAMGRAAARRTPVPLLYPRLRLQLGSIPDDVRTYMLRDEQGKLHHAYRVVVARGLVGEYYGVQGMDWTDPPILADPSITRRVAGRTYWLYYDGSRVRRIVWHTKHAVYWLSNTLLESLGMHEMLAIADATQPLPR